MNEETTLAKNASLVRKNLARLVIFGLAIAIIYLILLKSQCGTNPSSQTIGVNELAARQPGSPVFNANSKQVGVQCPASQCATSGSASNETCYIYPDYASSLAECEQKKSVYPKICDFLK
jgi:hypothetical protein